MVLVAKDCARVASTSFSVSVVDSLTWLTPTAIAVGSLAVGLGALMAAAYCKWWKPRQGDYKPIPDNKADAPSVSSIYKPT